MTKLVIKNSTLKLVLGASQGPEGIQGKAGPPGGGGIQAKAGTNLGGHRAVILDANNTLQYASASNLAHIQRIVGITLNAAATGDPITIQNFGEVIEPSWNWDVTKAVFVGDNGVLTQVTPVLPDSKFSMVVGFPNSPTSLFVKLSQPIILN